MLCFSMKTILRQASIIRYRSGFEDPVPQCNFFALQHIYHRQMGNVSINYAPGMNTPLRLI